MCSRIEPADADIAALGRELRPHAGWDRHETRNAAANTFVYNPGPDLPPVVLAQIIRRLTDRYTGPPENRSFSHPATEFVGVVRYGPSAKAVVPLIVQELRSSGDPSTRAILCRHLAQVGPGASSTLSDLEKVRQSSGWEAAWAATDAIKAVSEAK
jgi:hypothetical protein